MRRTATFTALGLVVGLSLTGCFANPLEQLGEQVGEGIVEEIVEGQTGTEVDFGDGASLPEGFPNLPTPSEGLQASFGADGSYSLTYSLPNVDAVQQLEDDLLLAGFARSAEMDLGDGSGTSTYENTEYTVALIWGVNDDGTVGLQYSVVPLAS